MKKALLILAASSVIFSCRNKANDEPKTKMVHLSIYSLNPEFKLRYSAKGQDYEQVHNTRTLEKDVEIYETQMDKAFAVSNVRLNPKDSMSITLRIDNRTITEKDYWVNTWGELAVQPSRAK